jgi:hypothetical protein
MVKTCSNDQENRDSADVLRLRMQCLGLFVKCCGGILEELEALRV